MENVSTKAKQRKKNSERTQQAPKFKLTWQPYQEDLEILDPYTRTTMTIYTFALQWKVIQSQKRNEMQ